MKTIYLLSLIFIMSLASCGKQTVEEDAVFDEPEDGVVLDSEEVPEEMVKETDSLQNEAEELENEVDSLLNEI